MAAHLQEAAIVLPFLADEDRLHRGLHVIVDAARAGPAEERERPVMGIEDHLLRLARIGSHIHHPAVAEPDMRHLHRRRHAVQHDDLVAPVKLVSLARRIIERHVGFRRYGAAFLRPGSGVAPDCVVTALVAEVAQVLEYPDQCQPFARGFGLIGEQHSIELIAPGAELRLRLTGPLVLDLRLIAAQNLPHHFPRYAKLPADRLDRLALHTGKSTYL